MASTDITPVVARLKNRIQTISNIGVVHGFDVYSHKDIRPLIVSTIATVETLRAWWITGPIMVGRRAAQAGGELERSWQYQIHGIEGVSENGDSIETLRSNALAVSDAIDADFDLNGTCHRTDPCTWRVQPENRQILAGVGVAYVQIVKPVVTLSLPS